MCAIVAWEGYKSGKGAAKKGPNREGPWYRGIVEKELTNGRVAEEMTGERQVARKAPRGSKSDWYSDKDRGSNGSKDMWQKSEEGKKKSKKGEQSEKRVTRVQRVIRIYKELQGITRVYKGLQGLTRAHKGLQGITIRGIRRKEKRYLQKFKKKR